MRVITSEAQASWCTQCTTWCHNLTTHFTFCGRCAAPLQQKVENRINRDSVWKSQLLWMFWLVEILKLYNCLKCVTVKVTTKCHLSFSRPFFWDADCRNLSNVESENSSSNVIFGSEIPLVSFLGALKMGTESLSTWQLWLTPCLWKENLCNS